MKLSFRETLRRYVPPWLSDRPSSGLTVGFRFLYCLVAPLDAGVQAALEGLQAHYPGQGTPTALPLIGRDRRILRGFIESDDSYAARLRGWLDDWRIAGEAFSLMRQIRGYLTPHPVLLRTVDNNGNWFTLREDGSTEVVQTQPASNWNWDGNAALGSRFWLIVYPHPALWTEGAPWGDPAQWGGVWGIPSRSWGTTATQDQIASIKTVIQQWKPAHARCSHVIIAFDPASFDPTLSPGAPLPDGTWGIWHKIELGVAVPSRLQSARYWEIEL